MNRTEIENLIDKLRTTERSAGLLRFQAISPLFFVLGILTGIILGLGVNVLHDLLSSAFGRWYQLIALALTALFILIMFRYLRKHYLSPISQLEKESDSIISAIRRHVLE